MELTTYTETPLDPIKRKKDVNGFSFVVSEPDDKEKKEALLKAIKEAKNPLNRNSDFPWLDPDVTWFLNLAIECLYRKRPKLFRDLG